MATDESKNKGYELTDTPPSPVVVGIVVLLLLMVVGFIGGRMFQDLFEATEVNSRPKPGPMVTDEQVKGPLLQANPAVEIGAYKETQRTLQKTYGWVDRARGVVRIPIEKAIEKVARDGFPEWAPVNARLPEPAESPESEDPETGSEDSETAEE